MREVRLDRSMGRASRFEGVGYALEMEWLPALQKIGRLSGMDWTDMYYTFRRVVSGGNGMGLHLLCFDVWWL